jgi:CRISPR-associated protein Cst2
VLPSNEGINTRLLSETVEDFKNEILSVVFGGRKELFKVLPENTLSLGDAFVAMDNWVDNYYL